MACFGGTRQPGCRGNSCPNVLFLRERCACGLGPVLIPGPAGPVAQWLEPAAHNRLVAGSKSCRAHQFLCACRRRAPRYQSRNAIAVSGSGNRRLMPQTIVCAKWGTRYPALYVNSLWSMIRRNTTRPDAPRLLHRRPVRPRPGHRHPPDARVGAAHEDRQPPLAQAGVLASRPRGHFRRRAVPRSRHRHYRLARRVLRLRPRFHLLRDRELDADGLRHRQHLGYRFRVGAHTATSTTRCAATPRRCRRPPNSRPSVGAPLRRGVLARGLVPELQAYLLPPWPLNFFRVAPLPGDTKIVCFTGKPDPDEARDGRWDGADPQEDLQARAADAVDCRALARVASRVPERRPGARPLRPAAGRTRARRSGRRRRTSSTWRS